MIQYFDTHAHYDSGKFNADRDEVLRAVHDSGVALVVDPGDSGVTSERAAHIRALAAQPKVCAIGEIGLDYYWDASTKAKQERMFRAQLELALELDLPVIVHDREAHGDSLRIVCDYPQLRGVFHCYSGSVEMARELLRRGWYLGFDGPITYKNAARAPEVIAACPAERILLETDSPYLAPVPNRGKRNDSRNLPFIAARVAEIKGMTIDQVAEVTLQNGKKLFDL